jgi:hypothetical protein
MAKTFKNVRLPAWLVIECEQVAKARGISFNDLIEASMYQRIAENLLTPTHRRKALVDEMNAFAAEETKRAKEITKRRSGK